MKLMPSVICLLLLTQTRFAQSAGSSVFHVPFASRGNTIALDVFNDSPKGMNQIRVSADVYPSWVDLSAGTFQAITLIKPKRMEEVQFKFDVDKLAPCDKETTLTFLLADPQTRQVWKKMLRIVVDGPKSYDLFQNYPNPYNPQTRIPYQVPASERVSIVIYNVLGETIATLLDNEVRQPGYYEAVWNGSAFPSGMYFYRLHAGSFTATKKMLLLR
jgi:hypothetical protein